MNLRFTSADEAFREEAGAFARLIPFGPAMRGVLRGDTDYHMERHMERHCAAMTD
jgi:hypothetical protein